LLGSTVGMSCAATRIGQDSNARPIKRASLGTRSSRSRSRCL